MVVRAEDTVSGKLLTKGAPSFRTDGHALKTGVV